MSTIEARRLQKAVWLEVQPVAPGRYLVSGGADDHLVVILDGMCQCDCIDAQRRGGPCKHIIRVGLASGDRSVIEGLRTLIPNPRHFPAKRRQGAAS